MGIFAPLRRWRAVIVASLVLLGCACGTARAEPVNLLESAFAASSTASFTDVRKGRVHLVPYAQLHQRGTPRRLWLRFPIRVPAAAGDGPLLLTLPRTVTSAEIYLSGPHGYRMHRIGAGVAFARQASPYLTPSLPIDQAEMGTLPVYARLTYYPETPLTLTLRPAYEAVTHALLFRIVEGLFFGVLLAVGLSNLYVGVVLRDRGARYFVLYIAALLFNEMVATGIGSAYLWPLAAIDPRWIGFIANTAAFGLFLPFVRTFLGTRKATPLWDKLLIASFVAEASVDFLRHALPDGAVLGLPLLLVQIAGMLVTIATSLIRINQGFLPARFFAVAFAPAVAGFIANLAYDLYAPQTGNWFVAENGVEFGAMFEAVILSFSLLDRIRSLDAARQSTQAELHRTALRAEALRELALTDPLTGIANRMAFVDRLRKAVEGARKTGTRLGVLYIDLDGFKAVNDRYGHHIGDELLQVVAKRLRNAVRSTDHVARLGGDEFAILVTGGDAEEALEAVRENVLQMLFSPTTIEGKRVPIGLSVGASLFPRDGDGADRLLDAADRAMYVEKAQRKTKTTHQEIEVTGLETEATTL